MNRELEVMAKTIYGEASSETFTGKLAVAYVIMNRVKKGKWGKDAASVCWAPLQFSCWNKNDPGPLRIAKTTFDNPAFRECLAAAICAYDTVLPDPTEGADHYYATTIAEPFWAKSMKLTVKIGVHKFFKS